MELFISLTGRYLSVNFQLRLSVPVPPSPVQIAVDHGPQIGTVKPIGSLKAFLIHPFKILKMILNTLVIDRILCPARAVEGIFRRVFSSISGTMLHRDWGGFGFVFRRHVDDLFV
jgi:hypothetical protein